jgi:hypothetical protein
VLQHGESLQQHLLQQIRDLVQCSTTVVGKVGHHQLVADGTQQQSTAVAAGRSLQSCSKVTEVQQQQQQQ